MSLTDMVIMPGADYQAICDSVRSKTGGTDVLKSGDIPAAIEGISGGGSVTPSFTSVEPKDVNFYDYDGTLLYSYTLEEFDSVTELPPLPTHEGLVAQIWNYDSVDAIKTYGKPLDVGANYITTDGKTRLYITNDARLDQTVMITQTVADSATIDWGDGSNTETTGSETGSITLTHTYATPCDYVISITVASGRYISLGDATSTSYCVMGDSSKSYYCNNLRKVELGTGINNLAYAFYNCSLLESITIPVSITAIGMYAFYNCRSLRCAVIPPSIAASGGNVHNLTFALCYSMKVISLPYINGMSTTIGNGAFSACLALRRITLPDCVSIISDSAFDNCNNLRECIFSLSTTEIGAMSFNRCSSIKRFDFTKLTTVPTLVNVSAFTGYIPPDYEIRVPSALYNSWIAANNWATFSSYIVAV